jgi:alkaline phosphatase
MMKPTKESITRRLAPTVVALAVVMAAAPALANGPWWRFRRTPRPKNIIVMISDGCGYYHVDVASIYQYGATGTQVYETWPVKLGMSTYKIAQTYEPSMAWSHFTYVKREYTDSAAAATAMSTGKKTYAGAIGVDTDGWPLTHIAQRAEELGKATGVITSVQVSHATPAGYVAHNVARGNYAEIAQEMIYESATDVVMGCGHPAFGNNGEALTTDPSTWEYKYVGGQATWLELIAGTAASDADGDGVDDPWSLVTTRAAFQALMTGPTPERVIGVAEVALTLQYNRSQVPNETDPYDAPLIETVPTLPEMTKAALNVLDNDPDGFFLMIEGGAVDWAGHANSSNRLIEEEIDFNRAVEAVCEWVEANGGWQETLVVVTADHECGYLTGPGSGPGHGPGCATWTPLVNNGAGNLPGMQWNSGDHTNALVPLYARGRGCMQLCWHVPKYDPVRGLYIDNTELARSLFSLWH